MCRAAEHGGRRCDGHRTGRTAAEGARSHVERLRSRQDAYVEVPVEQQKHHAAQLSARKGVPNPLKDYTTRELKAMTEDERAALYKGLPDDLNPSLKLRDRHADTVSIAVQAAAASIPTVPSNAFERMARDLIAGFTKRAAAEYLEVVMVGLSRYCEQTGTNLEDYDIPAIATDLSKRHNELRQMNDSDRERTLDGVFAQHCSNRTPKVTRDIAHSPVTSADMLRALSTENDWETRWGVARNPSTPLDVLHVLAHENDKDIRSGVEGNRVFVAEAERNGITPRLALVGVIDKFTPEQYDEFRDAPDEWIEGMLSSV